MSSHDKVAGMIAAFAVGDALGSPHELEYNRTGQYTGYIYIPCRIKSQWRGSRDSALGQLSDDTEMLLTLSKSLIKFHGYNKDEVIKDYLKWANGKIPFLGRNTKNLFKGVTTIKGYQKRYNEEIKKPMDQWSQSNGGMMRSPPMALLSDFNLAMEDVKITNFHPVSIDANMIYISILWMILRGYTKEQVINHIKISGQTKEVKEVIEQATDRKIRDLTKNKGHCLNSLHVAISALYFDNIQNFYDWVIQQPDSDTDTNAAIGGAVIGAFLGYENLLKEEKMKYNLPLVLSCDTTKGDIPRPIEYSLHDFKELTYELFKLTQ